MNPLHGIWELGQSVWYDNIHRKMISSGELSRMINEDGLRGVTSNPAIFEKAITGYKDYDQAIENYLAQHPNTTSRELFYHLAIEDIQQAADQLLHIYHAHQGRDGYVSLEVSPDLAHDTEGTIKEAKELWEKVGRKNLMIKVPATKVGVSAIETLIYEGININATLLFSVERYQEVAQAYISGLTQRIENNLPVDHISSVASFFISRVDSAIENQAQYDKQLQGKVAIANAKLAYQRYLDIFSQSNFTELANAQAQTQRLLWASTGTKSKELSDVLYLEQLIGPNTVTTVPPATYDAYKDHGKPLSTLTQDTREAQDIINQLQDLGINLDAITEQLEKEGVDAFAKAFTTLLSAIDQKVSSATSNNLTTA